MTCSCLEYWSRGWIKNSKKRLLNNKSKFNTFRTCTSVAGQITLILRSRSRVLPNHPKSHVYYKNHRREIINNEQDPSFFFLKKKSYNVCAFFQFNSLYISIFREETGRVFRIKCRFFNSNDCLNFVGGVCGVWKSAEKDDRMSKGILEQDFNEREFIETGK